MPNELELVPTDVLLDELRGRFDGLVVIMMTTREEEDVYRQVFKGGQALCIGLCEMMKADLVHDHVQGQERVDWEESEDD